MHEYEELALIPVKAYQSENRLTVAAPMPGLQPEDISVRIGADGRLELRGELRGELKNIKEVLLNEWSVGGYYRELLLPVGVDGEQANVTYDNGVLVVAMPLSDQTRPANLTLEPVGRARGQRLGSSGRQSMAASSLDDADDIDADAQIGMAGA